MVLRICLLLSALIILSSCQGANDNRAGTNQSTLQPGANNRSEQTGGEKMAIRLTSTAFNEGEMIPAKYTCDGANVSPPLSWTGAPEKTKSLALIADDPDAPGKTWVHWVVYDLPASANSLPENVAKQETISSGGKQGTTDFKKIGYGGPCPPSGTHRYFFKIYALDDETELKPGATKDELLKAMEGHTVAQGQLMGKYKR